MSGAQAEKLKYRIGGMDCASCVQKIENAVKRLPGVDEVGISLAAGTMTVQSNDGLTKGAIEQQVKALGYSIAAAKSGARPAAPAAVNHEHHDDGDHDHHDHNHVHDHDDHDHGAEQAEAGEAAGHAHDHFDLGEGPWWKSRKAVLAAVTGLALALTYLVHLAMPGVPQWIFVPALAVGLVPIGRRAIVAAMTGTPFSIEMLMTIAAIGALLIGAAEEAVTVVFLFLVGELLEGVAAQRARASIRGLTDLVPKTALVERGGTTEEIAADGLRIGDVILVRPGDRIAADGVIVEGASAINEAPVTGESVPKTKSSGDPVFAGTINADAVLKIRVTAAPEDNTIARVVRLVEEAQESKAPTERFIDRFSRYYTPGVLVVGALVAVLPPLLLAQSWPEWIYKGLAILLIGCPCALVISTPAAIAAGLSAGARRGLLIKGGAVIETLAKVNLVALDKTGTLTEGKPVVTDIVGAGRPEAKVLSLAAALENGSNHPLAVAILARAKTDGAPVPPAANARALPGKGVSGAVGGEEILLLSPDAAAERVTLDDDMRARIAGFNGEGKTVSVLMAGGALAGLIAMRDEPRADAKAGLAALADEKIATLMLTGDNETTAQAIGGTLGIAVRAGLMPEDKQAIVRQKQSEGLVVAKVGDGINDAPALAAANVGIAMGGGTDVALETADAAVLHGRVADIAGMVSLARATMGNIHQNVAVALGLKGLFLVTTVAGLTGLWPAILADTGATVLVTINALRLLGWRGR
jgi:Cd2+/Zn2+-exporting ATPase